MENKYSNLNDDYKSLKVDYNQLNDTKTKLDNELNLLKEEYKELNDTKTEFEVQLNILKNENEELKNNNTDLNNEVNLLKDENEELKNNNTELDNELNSLKEEYEQLENQYSSQNDTLNDRFNSLQNLIFTANIENSYISKDNYTNIKQTLESVKEFNDGTYDFITMEEVNYEQGYQIAFETLSRNWENYYSDEEYDEIVYKLASLFGVEANIGIYGNNPHISFYSENLNISLSMAALFNQKSIWDWAHNTEILNSFHQPEYY